MDRDPTSWNGRWWLAGDPQNKQPGILTRGQDDSLRLELVGGFSLVGQEPMASGSALQSFYERRHVPLIVGETDHGLVSLLDCLVTGGDHYTHVSTLRTFLNTAQGTRPPDYQRFVVHTGLMGVALQSPDEPIFRQMRLRIENLAPFLGSSGPGVVLLGDNGTTAELPDLPELPAVDVDGLQFRVTFSRTGFHLVRRTDEWDVTSTLTTALCITSPELTSYDRLTSYTKRLMNLLSLATNQPCGTLSETLDENDRDADTVRIVENKIRKPDRSRQIRDWWRFRFSCDDVPFDQLLPAWLDLSARTGPAIDLLLAPVYSANSYLQERLLDVAAAAETFHTGVYNFEPRPQREFDLLLGSMLAGVDSSGDRDWIRSRFSNTPSYGKRLNDLLQHPDQAAMNVVVPEPKKWVRLLTDVRNIVAHGKKTPLPPVLECRLLMQQTTLVVVLNVMHQLGVGPERQMAVASDADLADLRRQIETRSAIGER